MSACSGQRALLRCLQLPAGSQRQEKRMISLGHWCPPMEVPGKAANTTNFGVVYRVWGRQAGVFIAPSLFLKGARTRVQLHGWRSHHTTLLCQGSQAPTISCGIWDGKEGCGHRAGLGFTWSHSCSTQCAGQFLSPHGWTARGLVAGSHCELEITLPSRLRHAMKRLMRPSPHEPEHLEE